MIRLKDTRFPHTAAFLSHAVRTAEYYGFTPLDRLQRVRLPAQKTRTDEIAFTRRDERMLASSAKLCASCVREPNQTLFLWKINADSRDRSNMPSSSIELHVVGAPHALAEALLIVVSDAIARDAGIEKRTLAINSIGSPDSSNRFIRDVATFLRKNLDSISPVLRSRAQSDPLGTLIQLFEKGHPATPRAPQAVEYLTEEERQRFWKVLEYLEALGMPYELSASVLGSRDFWNHTLFEMSFTDPVSGSAIPFAFGGKYDPIASRFAQRDTSAALVCIHCETRGKTRVTEERHPSPSIYFAHLGGEARRRVLPVLEMLRKENIPVYQSLMHERLGDQMEHAKRQKVSHMLLIGHKEAVEGTVLVREVVTNAQEAVPMGELPAYLRRSGALAVA